MVQGISVWAYSPQLKPFILTQPLTLTPQARIAQTLATRIPLPLRASEAYGLKGLAFGV